MIARSIGFLFVLLLAATAAHAQDMIGQWQGALHISDRDYRIMLRVEKSGDDLGATVYSLDESKMGYAGTLKMNDDAVSFSTREMRVPATFEGKLSKDGNTLTGSYTQGDAYPLVLQRATPQTAWVMDTSAHRVQFVTVDRDVRLEVLDWGGTGAPLVFLAGLGADAHTFDELAPKLTTHHHVYAITRRGYGASSAPEPDRADYSAKRRGDDVVAVIDFLKLRRPVLAGHSIAGSELSAIANNHADKIGGAIYLDAGANYAFFSPGISEPLVAPAMSSEAKQDRIDHAIMAGLQEFRAIPVPVLAIFAIEPKLPENLTAAQKKQIDDQIARGNAQIAAFERGVSSARVVRLPGAEHRLWQSDEARVIHEMDAFMDEQQRAAR